MSNKITIEDFNKMVGQESLHPLVTVFRNVSSHDVCHSSQRISFYALIYKPSQSSLHLYRPGDEMAFTFDFSEGVMFHPDLLCGSHLEHDIDNYPVRCRCKALQEAERKTIVDCLADIDSELHHSIDRFSSLIIVSHIGLLLDYCVRFCSTKSNSASISSHVAV